MRAPGLKIGGTVPKFNRASNSSPVPLLPQQESVPETKPAGVVSEPPAETVEQSWFRATSTSPAGWLSEDEDQRRYRLDAAQVAAGTPLSEEQRETLLQRMDEFASRSSGEPMPVYRGTPYDAPNSGQYVAAGEAAAPPASSSGLGMLAFVALVGFGTAAAIEMATDKTRSNPVKRAVAKIRW